MGKNQNVGRRLLGGAESKVRLMVSNKEKRGKKGDDLKRWKRMFAVMPADSDGCKWAIGSIGATGVFLQEWRPSPENSPRVDAEIDSAVSEHMSTAVAWSLSGMITA